MDNHYNIYICGVGGQGIIKTSTIIGEAAMNQGLDVVMSEIHGMSQRGGSVSTELKIGGFNSSIIPNQGADMLLAFEPIETIRGLDKVNSQTKIVYNTHPIVPSSTAPRRASCCDLLKRCISSMNNIGEAPLPKMELERALSITSLTSFTPELTAERVKNSRPSDLATI